MSDVMEKPTAGQLATWACVAEVLAPKAGNVTPDHPFEDVSWVDFVVSATQIGPHLDRVHKVGVGATVLACVRDTREAIETNANLGMILLLAPLCAVPEGTRLIDGIGAVLGSLTDEDAAAVYEAIRLASPGGLGKVSQADVTEASTPKVSLVDAMRLSAERDAVARQYADGFGDVLARLAPRLMTLVEQGLGVDLALARLHLEQMAHESDSLIRRKAGEKVAAEARDWAARVVELDWPRTPASENAWHAFDGWLRADGRRRNPGTTADLVTATLFAALRDHDLDYPLPWSSMLPW